MNMEFATAAQVQDGFGTGLTAMLVAVSAMAIAAYAGGRHLATPLRLRWVAVGYALALCQAVGTVYVSIWGRFVQLQVNGPGMELRYAGSWQLPVRVPRDQVQTVLVGWGKPGRPCYLRVVLRDGSSHRSAELPAPASQCRVLQAQLLGLSDTGVPLERLTKLSEAVLARRRVAGSTRSTTRRGNEARRVLLAALSRVASSVRLVCGCSPVDLAECKAA